MSFVSNTVLNSYFLKILYVLFQTLKKQPAFLTELKHNKVWTFGTLSEMYICTYYAICRIFSSSVHFPVLHIAESICNTNMFSKMTAIPKELLSLGQGESLCPIKQSESSSKKIAPVADGANKTVFVWYLCTKVCHIL